MTSTMLSQLRLPISPQFGHHSVQHPMLDTVIHTLAKKRVANSFPFCYKVMCAHYLVNYDTTHDNQNNYGDSR